MDLAYIGANPEKGISHTFASYELCEEHLMERFKSDSEHFKHNLTTSSGQITLKVFSKYDEGLTATASCHEIILSN